jgi:hypothetical protein
MPRVYSLSDQARLLRAPSSKIRSAINEGRNLMTVHAPISKFPQVDQADASRELAEIYDDIRFALRMPWVRRIRAIARKDVAGFSGVGGVSRRQMSDSLRGPEIAGLTGLLFMYNRFIADITIAMIRVKQAPCRSFIS